MRRGVSALPSIVAAPRAAGCPHRGTGAPLHAAGASVQEMGAAPGWRSAAPAPSSDAPGRWNSAPVPASDAPARRNSAPATASDAPGSGNSAPAASSAAPERNGGGVCRGKSTVSGQKAAPGGKMGRLERKSGFMADIGCDEPDWSTAPAWAVSPTFRTGGKVA